MLKRTEDRRDDVTNVRVVKVDLREHICESCDKALFQHHLRDMRWDILAVFLTVDVETHGQKAVAEIGESEKTALAAFGVIGRRQVF